MALHQLFTLAFALHLEPLPTLDYAAVPYIKDPAHSKFINAEILERYWAVGGVRIEDDVLITADGFENLTEVPKATEEIEALMAS